MDRQQCRQDRAEAQSRAAPSAPQRSRDLRSLSAASGADVSGRRIADEQRAFSTSPPAPPVGREEPRRYHADVTAPSNRFHVRGVFCRQFLVFAILNVPAWTEPIVIAVWAMLFLLWGPGRRGVMSNLKSIKPGSTAFMNFF